jgi:hypothetical protein
MHPKEKAVRDAAGALQAAVAEAEAIGFRVDLPRRSSELGAIAISETKHFVAALEVNKGERVTVTKRAKKS